MTATGKKTLRLLSAILLIGILAATLAACFGGDVVIKFNENGGTPCEDVTVEKGTERLVLPTTTKDGYIFDGWYKDRALTVPIESVLEGADVPTASLTLYANWKVRNVTVTFSAGEEIVGELVVPYGTRVKPASYPSLEGYEGYEWRAAEFSATYDREVRAVGVGGTEEQFFATYYVPTENGFVEYARFAADAEGNVSLPSTPDAGANAYFGGWYYSSAYTNLCEELPTNVSGGDIILYARFVPIRDDTKYLFYEETAQGVVITGFTGVGSYQTSIAIPASIGGKPVIRVGSGAARSLSSAFLETVVFAAGVQEIADGTFSGCSALKEIVFLGEEITRIGEEAFADCAALTSFGLPDSVTVIGDGAFLRDGRLTEFAIGAESKLSHIGARAFEGCDALTAITLGKVIREVSYDAFLGSGLTELSVHDGGKLKGVDGVLFTANGETLVYYPAHGAAEYSIPDGVTTIAAEAFFSNTDLTSVVADAALVSVGDRAFGGCVNLTSAELSASALQSVGREAFFGCEKLTGVRFPATLRTVGNGAYEGCSALSALTFSPSGLRSVGDRAFYGCSALTSLVVPVTTETVGDYAFYGCSGIRTLDLTKGVLRSVGDYAFYDCTRIGSIVLNSTLAYVGDYAFASKENAMNLEFDNSTDMSGVEHFGEGAFMNTKIVSVAVSSRIATDADFGKYVFYGCTYLRQAFFSAAGYSVLPEGTFYGCTSLNRVTFPTNVVTVGKRAFYNCGAMEYADFGTHVYVIEESAFEGCTHLTNGNGVSQRILPSTLTTLGARAFYGCSTLDSVSIPAGLEKLEAYAFGNCASLSAINYDADSTLSTIGENAFYGCTSLTTANLPATLATKSDADDRGLVKNPFLGCSELTAFSIIGNAEGQFTANGLTVSGGVLYAKTREDGAYPELSVYAFPTAGSTGTYIVPALTEIGRSGEGYERQIVVTGIERYAFYGSRFTQLNFASIPESGGVEDVVFLKIGDYAFAESSLALIGNLSYRVTEIGAYAFYRCNLTALNVDGVYIGAQTVIRDGVPVTVYKDSSNKTKNVLNAEKPLDNLLTIGAYAFSETTLQAFTAPARVKEIGVGAFSKNYSLASLELNGGVTDNGCITDLVVGDYAFSENNLLTSVTIPGTTSRVGDYAFYRCYNVSSLRFGTRVAGSYEGPLDVGAYAFGEIHYLYSVTLPNNVRTLGEGVFAQNTRLKYVTFASELATDAGPDMSAPAIPDHAFVGATNMEEITVPAYITGVGAYAFRNTLLREVTFLGEASDADIVVGAYAFASLAELTSVTIPDNMTEIGEGAFYDTPLTDISISDAGKPLVIGAGAFEKTKLTEFTFGLRIREIGAGAFRNVSALTRIEIEAGNAYFTEIPEEAFCGDALLSEIGLNGILTVGKRAFYGAGVRELVSSDLLYVGENAFTASALSTVFVDASDTVTLMPYAFAAASELTSVDIAVPAGSRVDVRAYALAEDAALTSVTIRGVATLEAGFALHSSSIATFSIEDGNGFSLTDGAIYADGGATFLYYTPKREGATYELSDAVTAIADYAFADATGLTGVIVKGENVTIGRDSFPTSGNMTVYVAEDRVDTYINEWKIDNVSAELTALGGLVLTLNNLGQYVLTGYLGSASDLVVSGSMTEGSVTYVVSGIGENAFKNNVDLCSLTLGSGIKTVGVSAFQSCVNLTSVTLGENVTSVKSYAFYGCSALETVAFASEGSLIGIGNYAFAECPRLVEMDVPDTVETLGIFAFEGDTGLTRVTIGSGVQEIGNNAFSGCASLVSIDVPASVNRLGSYVFVGCEKLIYVNVEGRRVVQIENNTFSGTIDGIYFFVPDAAVEKAYKSDSVWRVHISKILSAENRLSEAGYENYVVKEYGDGYSLVAYLGTEEEVTIKSAVTSDVTIVALGEYCIGQFARKVTVEEGVTELYARSFYYAENLTEVVLPSTVKTVGPAAFLGLRNLTTVRVNTRKERKQVVLKSDVDAGRTVEDAVQTVYENVTDLKTIGEGAFVGCFSLRVVEIPESVTTIGTRAFRDAAIETLTFRHADVNGTEWYQVNMGTEDRPSYQTAKYVRNTAPRGAPVYETVYKDSSLTIGDEAFYGNANLRELTLNCKLASVGTNAFAECTALESVYLNYEPRTVANAVPSGNGVTDGVFRKCDKLSVFLPTVDICTAVKNEWKSDVDKFKFVAKTYSSEGFVYAAINRDSVTVINYVGDETEITFPSTVRIGVTTYNVTRIGREATIKTNAATEVKGYVIGPNVTKVTLSEKVVTVGADAFRNSANLETVVLNSGVTTIESYAFAGCPKLKNINIPVTVTSIESFAFYDCDALNDGLIFDEPFTPPTSPTLVIGGYAFADCNGLESFYVTNLVRTVGGIRSTGNTSYGHTFDGCDKLARVTFSDSALVTRLETYCFANTALREITLPESLETVADSVFYGCERLARVYVTKEISVTEAAGNVFLGVDNPHLKVYVPESTFEAYSIAQGWRNKTVIMNKITADDAFAYELVSSTGVRLTDYRGDEETLVVPSGVRIQEASGLFSSYVVDSVGRYFANDRIRKVEFASVRINDATIAFAVTKVDDYAFASCTQLDEIHLPDTVTTLGQRAFEGCSSLTDVTLSYGLQEISEFTFYNCRSLREITLPSGINRIGNSAFTRCFNLARVRVTFGEEWEAANVTGSMGNSAFSDTGAGLGGLTVVVPDKSYGIMYSGWTDIRADVYAQSALVGDFVVAMNDRGTAYILVQYLGTEDVVDLTALTIKGFRIGEIAENAVGNEYTRFKVDESVEYAEADAWRMQTE